MTVYGLNVILAIAMAILTGILYLIWFQIIGRKRAYEKFEKASGKINDWRHLMMEAEVKKAAAIESVKTNGLIAFDHDIDKFNHWLHTPISALNHQKPIDLIITSQGVELVNKELLRVEYSIY